MIVKKMRGGIRKGVSFLQNSMNQNYHKLAVTLLEKVGGKDNVINVYHCVTRLRFQLKDSSIPNTEEIEKIQGVRGCHVRGTISNHYRAGCS